MRIHYSFFGDRCNSTVGAERYVVFSRMSLQGPNRAKKMQGVGGGGAFFFYVPWGLKSRGLGYECLPIYFK